MVLFFHEYHGDDETFCLPVELHLKILLDSINIFPLPFLRNRFENVGVVLRVIFKGPPSGTRNDSQLINVRQSPLHFQVVQQQIVVYIHFPREARVQTVGLMGAVLIRATDIEIICINYTKVAQFGGNELLENQLVLTLVIIPAVFYRSVVVLA